MTNQENIDRLEALKAERPDDDHVRYELGNAYWKAQDWKHSLDNYTEAIQLNPNSPAAEMKKMVIDILQYRNIQIYNV